jgi:transcriptional regulator with XRE-family HTH domain
LDPSAEKPVQRFAAALRELRYEAGSPTYRTLSARSGYSVPALSQAAAGERLPTLAVVLAYARACGGDPVRWRKRWHLALQEEAARRPARDDARLPYRGLARFDTSDAPVFFGRERFVARLARLAEERRLALLCGPSGSGKSSVLRAGLIPLLRAPGTIAPPPAAVRILTPGVRPASDHRVRVAPAASGDGDTWLIVDQFEEVFTRCDDAEERDAFVRCLLRARDPDSRLRVVIAVRSDHIGRCAEHSALAAALGEAAVLTGAMGPEELRKAVVRPALVSGVLVARALTARILAEAGDEPGVLPLVSQALRETWRHRRGERIVTETDYEHVGGLHGVIVRTAEAVYAGLRAEAAGTAAVMRHVLLRLVAPGDGAPDTRRRASLGELTHAPGASVVIDRLVRARLLTLDDGTAHLAHEAVVTAWPRLRAWSDADRERLQTHRRLTTSALAWQAAGRDPRALYRASRLAKAWKAFSAADRAPELTPLEAAFLIASQRRHRRLEQARYVGIE